MDDDSQLNHNLCSIVIASIDFCSSAIFGNLRNESRQGDNPIFKLLYGIHSFVYCYGLQHDGDVFIFHEIRIKHSVIVIVKNGKCFFLSSSRRFPASNLNHLLVGYGLLMKSRYQEFRERSF